MQTWVWCLLAGWLALLVGEAIQLRLIAKTARRARIRRSSRTGRTGDLPNVQIIIPARNEQDDLPGCLDAALAQDYPELAVTVVDDRSNDRTAAIAAEYARRDHRVTVRSIRDLPAGWTGKAHAMWQAARRSDADWLLFVDADFKLDPWAVRSAIEHAGQHDAELLSLWPRMAAEGFWQQATMPLCAAYLALWFPTNLANQPASGVAFVNGQFLLIRRDAYQRIDGHRPVRDGIIEDIPFGEHAKHSGVRCRVGIGDDVAQVRMYRTTAAMIDGWSRIFLGGLRSRWKLAATMLIVLLSAWPMIAAALLAALAATGHVGWPTGSAAPLLNPIEFAAMTAFCAVHFAVFNATNWWIWRIAGLSKRWLWFYPAAIATVLVVVGRALWWHTTQRVVNWRGTIYTISHHARIVAEATTPSTPVPAGRGRDAA